MDDPALKDTAVMIVAGSSAVGSVSDMKIMQIGINQ